MIVFVVLLALLGLILYRIAHNPIFMMIVIIVALHWALAERARAADVEISATPEINRGRQKVAYMLPYASAYMHQLSERRKYATSVSLSPQRKRHTSMCGSSWK